MTQHRPPEGRREKHGKPMIPTTNRAAPPSDPNELAKVGGLKVIRRPIFQTTTDRQLWWVDMLISMQAAKRLGITHFEIGIEGDTARPLIPKATGYTMVSFGSDPAEEWKKSPESIGGGTLTVYAVVVE